ncbi:MAG TPA: monofunctional biosynthetic peptidoglycan transglycosylase [Nitrospiria bacterium]|jgi:monofunctional biosynthetic peptidoglycan transglycosylase|nr:monofunctional biosynthetic peptidoglycan transglycosylase [Nitrospiria bacterium]
MDGAAMKMAVGKILRTVALGVLLLAIATGAWLGWIVATLPDARLIATYKPEQATEVLDRNGIVLTQLTGEEFRIWAPLSEISPNLQIAVIAAEDDTFFHHEGINYKAAWEALKEDLKKKRYARGGSTITQQLVKNVFLTKEKTITRKVKEFILARRVEEILSKRRILELYLNEVEWGPGLFGAEAASRYYFDKHAADLTVAEGAMLSAMLVNPLRYDPEHNRTRLRHRQELILGLMQVDRLLTREEYEAALAEPIVFRYEKITAQFPISTESCHLRFLNAGLVDLGGGTRLYQAGHKIRTTLDAGLQKYLEEQLSQLSDRREPTRASARNDPPPGLLLVEEKNQILAMACVWGLEESAQAVELLKGLEPDSPREYRVVDPRRVAWRDLVTRS